MVQSSQIESSVNEQLKDAQSSALAEWVQRLSEVELPSVSTTVQKIKDLSQDESCALQALADVILQDAAMTTHVLRLTSSAYHVRGNKSNSVTRALVMLGFKEVRAICLSIAVLDDITKNTSRKPLTTELARAFHAAAQAEQFACAVGDRSTQEVFIAALLLELGRMLFWSFGGDKALELQAALEKSQLPEAEVERKVLGFELRELTTELAKKWGLGDLVIKAARCDEASDNRIKGVRLGHKFVRAVEKGWDSPEVVATISEISELTRMSDVVLTPLLQAAAEKAKAVALEFNAVLAAKEIPLPPKEGTVKKKETPQAFHPKDPDPAYQLTALRNISLKLESSPEVQDIIDLVLDGIFKGLGMDRAIFAILSPNRKYLSGKSGFGYQHAELISQFKFPLEPETPNIFQWVIEGQQAVWVQSQAEAQFTTLLNQSIKQVIGEAPFFIAPAIVTGKPVGVFFADRVASKRGLDIELFQTFKQFVMTGNISLEHLKMRHAQADFPMKRSE